MIKELDITFSADLFAGGVIIEYNRQCPDDLQLRSTNMEQQ